jgi:dihydrofolate reductase
VHKLVRRLDSPDLQRDRIYATPRAKLNEQAGRELQIHGSGALAQTLFDAGLIDAIRLIVFPVVLGSGKRLFAEGRTPSSFRLADVTSTPSGVTMQTLELTGPPEYGEVEIE